MVTRTRLFMTSHVQCRSCYFNKDRSELDSGATEPDMFCRHCRESHFLHFGIEMFHYSHLLINENWAKFKLISCIIIRGMFVGGDRAMASSSQGGSRVQIPAQFF